MLTICPARTSWMYAPVEVASASGVHAITCTPAPDRARLPPMSVPDAVLTTTPSNETGAIA
jgi:hypothetical protein